MRLILLSSFCKLFPTDILRLIITLIFGKVTYFAIFATSLIFCGQFGQDELKTAALSMCAFQIIAMTAASSISLVSECFFSLNEDSKNCYLVTAQLQRVFLACIPSIVVCCCFMTNSAIVFMLFGQPLEVALAVDRNLLLLIPGAIGMIVFCVLVEYTDGLGLMLPKICTFGACFFLNILLHYMFINFTTLKCQGSIIATSMSLTMMPIFHGSLVMRVLHGHFCCTNLCRWQKRAFIEWIPLYKTLVLHGSTQFLSHFGIHVTTLLVATLNRNEITAAHTALLYIFLIGHEISIGIGKIYAPIMSDYVARRAHRPFLQLMGQSTGLGMPLMFMVWVLRFKLAQLFTLDAEAQKLFFQILPLLCLCLIIYIPTNIGVASLQRSHYFRLNISLCIITHYLISIPLGVLLMFPYGFKLHGLWVTFILSSCMCYMFSVIFLLKLDWELMLSLKAASGKHSKSAQTQSIYDDDDFNYQMYTWRELMHSKIPVLLTFVTILVGSILLRNVLPVQTVAIAPASSLHNDIAPSSILLDIDVP